MPDISSAATIHGKVRDSLGNAVAYVNVGIVGTVWGTVTNSRGEYKIFTGEKFEWMATDSVRFSAIGYYDRTVALPKIVGDEMIDISVVMSVRQYSLAEVPVISPSLVRDVKGNSNTTTTMSNNMAISGQPGQNLGAEVGRKFNLGDGVNLLQKLNFYIKYCNYDTVVLRVNIYKMRSGKPAERLVNENLVYTVVNHRKGWVTFDLSEKEIVIQEPVVIALEWIGHSVKGTLLGFPITVPAPGAVHYYKFGSQAEWKRYLSMSTAMNIEYLTEP